MFQSERAITASLYCMSYDKHTARPGEGLDLPQIDDRNDSLK